MSDDHMEHVIQKALLSTVSMTDIWSVDTLILFDFWYGSSHQHPILHRRVLVYLSLCGPVTDVLLAQSYSITITATSNP